MKLSARNQPAGIVRGINEGAAIANVELDVAEQLLVASVTVEAVHDLGLVEGDAVAAVIEAFGCDPGEEMTAHSTHADVFRSNSTR